MPVKKLLSGSNTARDILRDEDDDDDDNDDEETGLELKVTRVQRDHSSYSSSLFPRPPPPLSFSHFLSLYFLILFYLLFPFVSSQPVRVTFIGQCAVSI